MSLAVFMLGVLLVLRETAAACSERCLQCLPDNSCVFCDFTAGYFARQGNCERINDPLCSLAGLSGECLLCSPGKYLDPVLGVCQTVPLMFRVNFCSAFDSQMVCVLCQQGYYLSGARCVRVSRLLPRCLAYTSDGICRQCEDGFYTTEKGDCTPFNLTANCLTYSRTRCTQCSQGFRLDPQKYFRNLGSPLALLEFLRRTSSDPWQSLFGPSDVCLNSTVPNCLDYNSTAYCTRCQTGFYLDGNSTCQPTPFRAISGCLRYLSPGICQVCKTGFFRRSPAECAAIVPIPNCAFYNNSASVTNCTQCQESFFLQNGACWSRVNSIAVANCSILSNSLDQCETCSDGLVPTTDGLRCLPAIPNCLKYRAISRSAVAMLCGACQDGFFPSSQESSTNACVPGAIQNCRSYDQNTGNCLVCLNAFYLSNGVCVAHQLLSSCNLYDPQTPNSCAECTAGFLRLKVDTYCAPVPVIQGCLTYLDSDPSKCSVCETGYYQSRDSSQCLPMPENQKNCAVLDKATLACLQCNPGSMMVTFLGTCVPIYRYITQNCLATDPLQPASDLLPSFPRCSLCNNNCVPRSGNNDAICMENTHLTFRRFPVIPNCVRYTSESPFRCCECAPGFVVSSTTSPSPICQVGCPVGSILVLDNMDGFHRACVVMTTPANFLGCTTVIRRVKTLATVDSQYSCIQVDSTTAVPLLANPSSFANEEILYPYAAVDARPSRFAHNGYSFSILPKTTATLSFDSNCEVYYLLSMTSAQVCRKCRFGMTVTVNYTGEHSCSPLPSGDCDTSQIRHGFPSYLESSLTCHVCLPKDGQPRLPWVNFKWDSTAKTISHLYVPSNSAVNSVACQQAPPSNSPLFVDNCAVYLNLTDASQAITVACAACLPGFRPTFDATNTFKVTTCTAITFCDLTVSQFTVSKCQKCIREIPGISSGAGFSDASFTTCIAAAIPDCWVALSATACLLCVPGYSLTFDGTCEPFVVPACSLKGSTPNLDAQLMATPSSPRLYYMSSFFLFVGGCQQCDSGYTRVHLTPTEKMCVPSTYIVGNSFIAASAFVPNCLRYWNTGSLISFSCQKCRASFTPTDDYRTCVTEVINCAFAQKNTPFLCATCLDGFLNIGGACVAPPLSGCRTYGNSTSLPAPFCLVCEDGYSLSSTGLCLKGVVDNCLSYAPNSISFCTLCKPGFSSFPSTDGTKADCVRMDPAGLCAAVDSTELGLLGGNFRCTACTKNRTNSYVLSQNVSAPTMCLPVRTIDYCQEYRQSTVIFANLAPACAKCQTGYFWDSVTASCRPRPTLDPRCSLYSDFSTDCVQCEAGYYLPGNGLPCTAFTVGIENCFQMLNQGICRYCDFPFYPLNGECVRSDFVIPNCQFYAARTRCLLCSPGFFLGFDGSCQVSLAKNCKEFANLTACSSCSQGFGLRVESNLTNCVSSYIPNCVNATSVYPFSCLICYAGYYVSEQGNCLPVTTLLPGCQIYSGPATCGQCQKSYALSALTGQCLPGRSLEFSPGCEALVALSQPECSVCQPGYLLTANATCTPFLANSIGCLWKASNSTRLCDICRVGYRSTADGLCIFVATGNSSFIESQAVAPEVPAGTPRLLLAACLLSLWAAFG